ncbi:type I-G CRISPR-associated protein Csb2 [Desulfonatronum thiodismutans]|uniref:type I-G CRISPR-associated protein Csb2 n=1 Tax=Desulfonatronum thiodismutans TaxID=159290 RepID=UPI001376CB97|nr:type I-U CRISPR-associated protein Csb2 [Desulfonatronum thiodismutans]
MYSLLISVRFHTGRFHGLDTDGRPEWPPSPARLFQALVASAAKGSSLSPDDQAALAWLEGLEPPVIAAPSVRKGQSYHTYMPNNDLDTVQGDPSRIAEVRSATKRFHPLIFDRDIPLLYAWRFSEDTGQAESIRSMADHLYQLGRGVDMAWAVAEVLDQEVVETRLSSHPGFIYRPALQGRGIRLAAPQKASLVSLIERHQKSCSRFTALVVLPPTKQGSLKTKVEYTFSQPPKPRFRQVPYQCPPARLLYEARTTTKQASFISWPLTEAVRYVELIRNGTADKLKTALPSKAVTILRVFGLCRDATDSDKAGRLRIIPLPSIGHTHADRGIRRLLVEIPPDCPLETDDVNWAFSGFGPHDLETGEVPWMLVPAEDDTMLAHYGIGEPDRHSYRKWRTVTPVALPTVRSHGRSTGSERAENEQQAVLAFSQALRHAGLPSMPTAIRVQREPFEAKGSLAENFAPGTRFGSNRLWHVELSYEQPMSGPMLVGDGRYLGLGLFQPVKSPQDIHAFSIVEGLSPQAEYFQIASALRRAVMSLVQSKLGLRKPLPLFFCGHESDGSPARRGGKAHLAFAFDQPRQRLLVIAPHRMEGRIPHSHERDHLRLLDAALAGLNELRAGPSGLLKLRPTIIDTATDPVFALATCWSTLTAYRPCRHAKRMTSEQAIIEDIVSDLHRRGLPKPQSVEATKISKGPKGGLCAHLNLFFSVGIHGPLLLGKNCNLGGGLFVVNPAISR